MAQNTEAILLIDTHGRVLGAQLASEARAAKTKDDKSRTDPAATLVPLDGQRAVRATVPSAILTLPGPDLHRLFSEARVRPNGELKLPKIRVTRGHMK